MAEALCPAARKHEHFESTQVVLKLKETQAHKRTPTCAKVAISRDGCDPRGCADSAGVSDNFPTGESRTHNLSVLDSNPSGPTNQPIEVTAVQIGVTNCHGSNGIRNGLFLGSLSAQLVPL